MREHVIIADDGAVRRIRLNRPAKKNALTDAMYETLSAAFAEGSANESIRCILIAGSDGVFCAGADIADFLRAAQEGEGLRPHTMRFLHTLAACDKPIAAAVEGLAVGIGATMLLHCDYVVAAHNARFATPFARLGLAPEAASSLLMPRLMGHRCAFELLVMGRSIDAARAQSLGLVNAVAPADEVEAEALKAAHDIAALPPAAVATARHLLRPPTSEILARIDAEAAVFTQRLKSPEAKAAFETFLARKQ
jgi:enoyl-CoA hydratase/carnithine racemase